MTLLGPAPPPAPASGAPIRLLIGEAEAVGERGTCSSRPPIPAHHCGSCTGPGWTWARALPSLSELGQHLPTGSTRDTQGSCELAFFSFFLHKLYAQWVLNSGPRGGEFLLCAPSQPGVPLVSRSPLQTCDELGSKVKEQGMCTLAEDDSCWAGRASAEIQSLGLSLDSCPGLDAGDSTFSLKEWGTSPLPCPPQGGQVPKRWEIRPLPGPPFQGLSLFFKRFIYLFDREIGRGRQRERGRSRLPADQRARCGARCQDPGTRT